MDSETCVCDSERAWRTQCVLYVNRYHNYLFVPFLLDLTFQLFVDDNNIISSVDA